MKYLTIFIIYVLDTFVHQRNLFKSLKKLNLDIKFIIDIGAHSGQYTLHFYKLFPNAKIIAFEPNKVLYNFLLKKFAHNNNIEVYEKAISSQNQKLNMIVTPLSLPFDILTICEISALQFLVTGYKIRGCR